MDAGPIRVEDLLRPLAPQVLGALVRRYGHFDRCEDAVQEALLAAAVQWPEQGVPENPRAWLVTVGSRRLTDDLRSEGARRRREEQTGVRASRADQQAPGPEERATDGDARRAGPTTTSSPCCSCAATPS